MLKKTLIYLGLGPDEEYDEYAPASGSVGQGEPTLAGARPTVRAVSGQPAPRSTSSTVRPIPASPANPSGSVRAIPAQQSTPAPAPRAISPARADPGQAASAVRIVEAPSAQPHALSPTSFNEAQAIGDRFKAGRAVIINLQGVDRDLRRRLVDFASGLCYAIGGKMDRVADQVYLLTPPDVVVSTADAQRAID